MKLPLSGFQRADILAVAGLYNFVLLQNMQPKCCHIVIVKKDYALFDLFVLHIKSQYF
jgi:hypothetical protein